MKIALPYGQSELHADLPDHWNTQFVTFPEVSVSSANPIVHALNHPIESSPLEQLARSANNAVILISDKTRMSPTKTIMPYILQKLHQSGLARDQIKIVVALGIHPPLTTKELQNLVGHEVYHQYQCLQHSPEEDECKYVGTTNIGTPISLFQPVVDADLRIATGNIEPHKLVGFSGGVKPLFPGCASRRTIYENHKLSQTLFPSTGVLEHPIRHDLEEVQQFAPVHFLLNTIMHPNGTILNAVAGDPIKAHRVGCEIARPIFFRKFNELYDVVIASCGGYPKDINLYQSVKTLQSAAKVTAVGGHIIWVTDSSEGFANEQFREWTEQVRDPKQTIDQFYRKFSLGGHKAAYILEITNEKTVWMVTRMKERSLLNLGLNISPTLQEAVNAVDGDMAGTRTLISPYAGFIHPS